MTAIDIEPIQGGGTLIIQPDPSNPGCAVLRFDDEYYPTTVLGSYKIRDLLIILHATAGEASAPTRSKRPSWMGGRTA